MDGALGQEELELIQRLSGISWQASEDIKTLCTLGASGTKQQAYEVRGRVQQAVKDFRSCLRSLKGLGEEQDTPEATEQLGRLVQEHHQQLERLKAGLQDSYTKMKANAQAEWKNDREALLSGSSDAHRKIQSQQQAVKVSQGVTESLRRTREQIAQEIELTDGNMQILGSSARGLSKAKDELQSQKEKFGTSRSLLSTMETHDIWDRIVLWGGILIFSIVAIYVFQERVLGVTPDFVKSSMSNVATSSFSAIYSLGMGLLKGNKTTEVVPKPFDVFEDLSTNTQNIPEVLEDSQIGAVPDPGVATCSGDESGDSCAWKSTTTTSEDDDIPSNAGHSTDSVREKLEALRKAQKASEPSLHNIENDILSSEGDTGGATDEQNLSEPVHSSQESVEESQEEDNDSGDNLPTDEEDQGPPETQTSKVQEDPVDESIVLDLEPSTTIDNKTEESGSLESGEKEIDDVEPKAMEEEIVTAAKKVLGDAISYVSAADDDDEYDDNDDVLEEDTAVQDSMDHGEASSGPANGTLNVQVPMDTTDSNDNNKEGVDVPSEDGNADKHQELSPGENGSDPDASSVDAGSIDTGSIDAGSIDAGSIDAGNEDMVIDAEDEDYYEDDVEESDEDSSKNLNNFDKDEL